MDLYVRVLAYFFRVTQKIVEILYGEWRHFKRGKFILSNIFFLVNPFFLEVGKVLNKFVGGNADLSIVSDIGFVKYRDKMLFAFSAFDTIYFNQNAFEYEFIRNSMQNPSREIVLLLLANAALYEVAEMVFRKVRFYFIYFFEKNVVKIQVFER